MNLPEFEFELNSAGCGTVKMNGEPLPGTVSVSLHSKAGEVTKVHVEFVAQSVKFKGPVQFNAIDITPLAVSPRCSQCGTVGVEITTANESVERYLCPNEACGRRWYTERPNA